MIILQNNKYIDPKLQILLFYIGKFGKRETTQEGFAARKGCYNDFSSNQAEIKV